MSEMKLTKGPWRAWHNHIFAGPFNVIKGGISGFRAELCTLNEDDLSEKELADIGRLIAAAPDLLKALRMAVRQNEDDMILTGEELRVCYAAIDKAKGHAHD